MDYTVKQLHKLSNNTLCERQIRRRCNLLQSKYPDLIKRTTNRMWLVNQIVADEVVRRKNNRIIDSQIINLGKPNGSDTYSTLQKTLNEIRQEYDTIEWKFFTGFRPKHKHDINYLFNIIKSITDEIEKRTKTNISIFYAIEKDNKKVYHVHMTISGSDEVKIIFINLFNFKFKELNLRPLYPEPFNQNHQESCYKYFSKEYFVDDKMRIGIIKQ